MLTLDTLNTNTLFNAIQKELFRINVKKNVIFLEMHVRNRLSTLNKALISQVCKIIVSLMTAYYFQPLYFVRSILNIHIDFSDILSKF